MREAVQAIVNKSVYNNTVSQSGKDDDDDDDDYNDDRIVVVSFSIHESFSDAGRNFF